jgi:hypothetical protein
MRGAAKVNAGNESSTRDDSDSIVGENIATTKDNKDDILDVAGASDEVITPVFMDIANVKNPPNSDFLAKSNDAGIPNLIYPLNVHHREGVGRMVEEWELAANKETKRIMMRDAMKAIATKIVDATNCCGKAVSDSEKGAARVFVTGKRGVGKVSVFANFLLAKYCELLAKLEKLSMFALSVLINVPSDSCTRWYSCVCPDKWSCCCLPSRWK